LRKWLVVPEDTIIIKAQTGTKAGWVRASNRLGMRLSEYVIEGMNVISSVFDVTIYWHDGGSLYLGAVYAENREKAAEIALKNYTGKNKKQAAEIEHGGAFDVVAELMPPADAGRWLAKLMAKRD